MSELEKNNTGMTMNRLMQVEAYRKAYFARASILRADKRALLRLCKSTITSRSMRGCMDILSRRRVVQQDAHAAWKIYPSRPLAITTMDVRTARAC